MPTLSIIACRMLEDEIAHLLSQDGEVHELLLVDGKEAQGLSRKLKRQNRPHILLGLECIRSHLQERRSRPGGFLSRRFGLSSGSGLVVVVSLLRLGLHSNLELLRAAVIEKIRSLSSFSDGILIFYGRCGDALADLEADLADLSCPICFLTDGQGRRIDDCIATALGGNENYDRALTEHKEVAVFLTPMWASNWKALSEEDASTGRSRDLRAMLKGTGLVKVARVDTGLSFEKGFQENVDDFAQEFGLEKIDLPGDTTVAEMSYERAKKSLLAGSTAAIASTERDRKTQPGKGKQTILHLCRKTWDRIVGISSGQRD